MGHPTLRKGTSEKPAASSSPSRSHSASDAALLEQLADAIPHVSTTVLEQELASKTALVETLTEQLERAAEEIDRMQRSGADRRRGSSLPVDLVDDHRQLVADMQRVVQQWEDLQAGFSLGRIEVQLTELREFVGDRLTAAPISSTLMESSSSPAIITEPTPLSGSRLLRNEPEQAAPASSVSAWEQLKSQMLGPSAESEPTADKPLPGAQWEPLPPAPEAVADGVSDTSELHAAIQARDAYIATLLRRIRTMEDLALPSDWTELSAAAPDLTGSLQHMSARLEETLRMAEVEISLERAQVARDKMQLAAQQELISKHLKRLGVGSIDELRGLDAPNANSANDRRWARFLGGKKS